MNKESVDMEKYESDFDVVTRRSEISNKVKSEIKEGSSKPKKTRVKKEVDLEQTIALNEVLKKTNPKKYSEEEKRSEIDGKFKNTKKKKSIEISSDDKKSKEVKSEDVSVKSGTKKVKSRKIRVDKSLVKEIEEDNVQESVENVSVAMMIMIILICFVVGTILGYVLYKVALGNSDFLSVMTNYLF